MAIMAINQSLLSPHLFFNAFKKIKGGNVVLFGIFYGRFRSINSASTAPIMITTIITAAIPNSTVPVDAKPDTGAAVGAGLAGDDATYMLVSAVEPKLP